MGAVVNKFIRVDPGVSISMINNLMMLPERVDKFFANVLLQTFTRLDIGVLCRIKVTLDFLNRHKAIISHIKMLKDSQDNISSEFVKGSLDHTDELFIADVTIVIFVEALEQTLNVSWSNLQTQLF